MSSAPVRSFVDPDAHRWSEENQRGLALAAADDWTGASGAFTAAAEALAANESRDPAAHEALALVLANLAQAKFHAGDADDAIRHAQRVCALRAALCGEDAVAVARSRSDLAVMLASTGRLEEAPALIARAIAGIEHSVGDEDLLLAVVLENAARVALAGGQPASAEPHLLRLHGLLGNHDLSTERADVLLAQVAEARADAELRSQVEQPTPMVAVVAESFVAPAAEPANVARVDDQRVDEAPVQDERPRHASLDDDGEWDDQPLRDAVVLTDVLLRSTPSGSPAVRAEAHAIDPWAAAPVVEAPEDAAPADAADPTMPVPASIPAEPVSAVESSSDAVGQHLELLGDDEIFGADALELTDALEAPPMPPAPATPEADAVDSVLGNIGGASTPRIERNVPVDRDNGLGFVVQYGTPLESGTHRAVPDRGFTPSPARSSDAIAREAAESSAMMEGDEEQIDVLTPPDTLPAIAGTSGDPAADAFDIGMVELTLADAPVVDTPVVDTPVIDTLVADTRVAAAPARDAGASESLPPATGIIAKAPGGIERRMTPRGSSVVMPSPVGSAVIHPSREEPARHGNDSGGARLTVQNVPPAAPPGPPRRSPRVAGADSSTSRLPLIGGGVGAIVLAIAGWWYMSGGF